MKKELKDKNKITRERIKELKDNANTVVGKNQAISQQIQQLQQAINTNNIEIIKVNGALEELERQLSK